MHEVEDEARVLRWSSVLRAGLARRQLPDRVEVPSQRVPTDPVAPPVTA